MTVSERAALPIGEYVPMPGMVRVWCEEMDGFADGWVVGDWAIHLAVNGRSGWTVTHVPTGLKIPTVHLSLAQARKLLGDLQGIERMHATGREWQGPPKAIKAQIKRIVRAVGAELLPKAKRAA